MTFSRALEMAQKSCRSITATLWLAETYRRMHSTQSLALIGKPPSTNLYRKQQTSQKINWILVLAARTDELSSAWQCGHARITAWLRTRVPLYTKIQAPAERTFYYKSMTVGTFVYISNVAAQPGPRLGRDPIPGSRHPGIPSGTKHVGTVHHR